MRFQGKSRLGFYPLPLSEAHRIRKFIQFPGTSSSALDPCVGDGAAFEVITNGAEVFRYGIELDAFRVEQAKQRVPNIVQGNTLEVQCPVECFGLLYLNPPYDWTLGPADSRRTEQSFLSHTYRWLKPAGILVFNHSSLGPAGRALAGWCDRLRKGRALLPSWQFPRNCCRAGCRELQGWVHRASRARRRHVLPLTRER